MDYNNTESLARSREELPFESAARRNSSTFDNIKSTVADKLRRAAGTIQQKVGRTNEPASAQARYGSRASEWLNTSADYIQDMNPTQLKADIQDQVRRNPGRSLAIAGVAGLLLGALLRRR